MSIFLFHVFLNESKLDIKKIEDDVKSTSEMINIIKKTKYQNESLKEKMIECLENPEETKQRYCLFLKLVYQNIYSVFEEEIKMIVMNKSNDYENYFNEDAKQFSKDYLKTDISVFKNRVNIHLSFFWNIGFEYCPKRSGDELIILGVNSQLISKNVPQKDKIFHFLKMISDKSRLEIIYLLSERPYYVNELAEVLNFSTATISYHLSKLQDLNIVDFKRKEQRFYYYLLKEHLQQLLGEVSELFISN